MSPSQLLLCLAVLAGACTHQDAAPAPPAPEHLASLESALTCSEEQLACASGCVDAYNDWKNCGACGNACASGLCYAGVCGDDHAGQVFVIGHSYVSSNKALERVLGNAVAMARDQVIDVLIYRGTNTSTLAWATSDAVGRGANQMARPTRRTFTPTTAGVMTLAPGADVLVISPQPQMSDAQLDVIAGDLDLPIDDLLRRGGVVIALDAPSQLNSGTPRILGRHFPVVRATTAPGATASIARPGSMPVSSVPLTFAIPNAVGYAPTGFEDVVTTESGHVLVAHRAFY